jgi:hypothetical protein
VEKLPLLPYTTNKRTRVIKTRKAISMKNKVVMRKPIKMILVISIK